MSKHVDPADVEVESPVTKLIPGFGEKTPVRMLQETLEYASSPRNYLIRRLGQDLFEKRYHLLSLPKEDVDRDMYGTGKHKQHFEQHIAKQILGKEHGLCFITGIQAQLVACKIFCDASKNDRVAWHYRSHLEIWEERGYEEVFHLKRTFVGRSQSEVPTVADIEAVTSRPAAERPAVIVLELPNRELGCRTYPWGDLVQISDLCKAAQVKLHMDGARFWEVEPYYQKHHGKTFADIAVLFNSVYVSFYKGLGGVCGAMLTSSDENFIKNAKTWQRRLGGNMVTSYQEVVENERAFNMNIGTFKLKYQKMQSVVAAITAATAGYRTKDGKPMVYFNPPIPTAPQIHTHIQGATAEQLTAARDAVEREFRIRVFKTTRPWQTPEEQGKAKVVQENDGTSEEGTVPEKEDQKEGPEKDHHFFEWVVNDENIGIGEDIFAKGWGELCKQLVRG